MQIDEAYNHWAEQYDTNINRTRDLEAKALRKMLAEIEIGHCLEIGCGTGKNTQWLANKAKQVTAVDFSDEMLRKAKTKLSNSNVSFVKADITQKWDFDNTVFDLVTFSLVLEHIEHLDKIFEKVSKVTQTGSFVYIGELHPFKQYQGTKARYETETGIQEVTCFIHHISDFVSPALKYGFEIISLNEFFDDDNRQLLPRIVSLILRKK